MSDEEERDIYDSANQEQPAATEAIAGPDGDGDEKESNKRSSDEDIPIPSAKKRKIEEKTKKEDTRVGSLEEPPVLERGAKRERKKTDRLSSAPAPDPEKKRLSVGEGSGTALRDIPIFEHVMSKKKPEDLKLLHRLLFNRPGTANEIRKNLRKFNGFSFSQSSEEYKKKKEHMNSKLTISQLSEMLELMGRERSGMKDVLVVRLLDFLMHPGDGGRKPPRKKKRKATASDGDKTPAKKSTKKATEKKSTKEPVSDDDEEADEEDEEDEEDKDEEDNEEEEAIEVKKSPKKKIEKKKPTPKSPVAKKPAAKKPAAKKPAAKKPAAKKPASGEAKVKKSAATTPEKSNKTTSDEAATSDDSSEDDEPLSAIKKPEPPTNEQLREDVTAILKEANLDEVTMKTIVKQVYDKYSTFDLSDRKTFIKQTVKDAL